MSEIQLGAVRAWLDAKAAAAEAEETATALKTEAALREAIVLEEFERAGVASVRLDDGRLVFLRRDLRASVKAAHGIGLARALQAEGLGDLVKQSVNANTLSAYVREREALGEPLPEAIAEHVNVAEMFSVRTRKR